MTFKNQAEQKKSENLDENSNNDTNKIKLFDSNLEYIKVGSIYIRNHNTKSCSTSNQVSSKTQINFKPFSRNREELRLEPYEEAVKANPQYFIEYSREVFEHLKKAESINSSTYGYMKIQHQINDIMRAVVINWLIEVHLKFELLPETLFLSVNLIDRYLNLKEIEKTELQLLGVSALLIASKYEEIYAPEVRDFIYATNKTCTREEILKMEYKILSSLNFETLHISSYRFLERFQFISNGDGNLKSFFLAQHFIELNLLDYEMLKYAASLKAACAIYLARKILKIDSNNYWSSHLISQTGYTEKDLQGCLKDIMNFISLVIKSKMNTVINKFKLDEYKRVANLVYDNLGTDEKDSHNSSSSS